MVFGSMLSIVAPQTALAADSVVGNCDGSPGIFLLGFPAWYRGIMISSDNGCTVDSSKGLTTIVWTVALNLLDIAILAVGYVSVGYVIYGGFLLMTSRGKPEYISEGQMTIRNAVIGLTISFGAVALINFALGGF